MGVVSKTSTPLSGSIENLGVGNNELFRNFGQARKGLASGSQSPLVTNSRTLSNTLPRKSTPSSSILEDQKTEGNIRVDREIGLHKIGIIKNRENPKG